MWLSIFDIFKPYLSKLIFRRISSYWVQNNDPSKLMLQESVLAQVLMQLRYGLLLYDLTYRFQTSPSTCSRIFLMWVRSLSKTLGYVLLVWLEKDLIAANLLDVSKGPYRKNRCIIDCSEVTLNIDRGKFLPLGFRRSISTNIF